MRSTLIAACALLTIATALEGSSDGGSAHRYVIGKIVDVRSKQPLSGIIVEIRSRDFMRVLYATETDRHGLFVLRVPSNTKRIDFLVRSRDASIQAKVCSITLDHAVKAIPVYEVGPPGTARNAPSIPAPVAAKTTRETVSYREYCAGPFAWHLGHCWVKNCGRWYFWCPSLCRWFVWTPGCRCACMSPCQ